MEQGDPEGRTLSEIDRFQWLSLSRELVLKIFRKHLANT